MWCWGEAGEPGGGDELANLDYPSGSAVPVPVIGLDAGVVSIHCSLQACLVVDVNGNVEYWGYFGPYGVGYTSDFSETKSAPTLVTGLPLPAVEVRGVDGDTACALLQDQTLWCWGEDDDGQLGNGQTTLTYVYAPQQVPNLAGVTDFGLESSAFFAITDGGLVYAGQAPTSTGPVTTPTALPIAGTPVSLASGELNSAECAVLTPGSVDCWGSYGSDWFTTPGPPNATAVPTAVANLPSNVVAVATTDEHGCALTFDGNVYCWGSNSFGDLGIGSTTPSLTAVGVQGLPPGEAIDISTGSFDSCAEMTTGAVYCWGSDELGVLGNGDTTGSFMTPVAAQLP